MPASGSRKQPMNDAIRDALINVIKANRLKMSRAQRSKGLKPQRWLYPYATESRYAATIRSWLKPIKDYVHAYLKENQEAVLRGDSADDSISALRFDAVPGKSFKVMIDSLNGWLGQYVPTDAEGVSGSPIYMGLGAIADSVFNFNEGQYEKGAWFALGVEFPVGEDWWEEARDMWAYQNYLMISGDMYKYVHDINGLVETAVTSGYTVKQLREQIMALDDKITKKRANFIARDQIGKLNGQVTQARNEAAGLTMYIWETCNDERVRSTHAAMNGKLCRWDDATVYSEDGGKTWIDRPASAVDLHPGFDYQCRCTAAAYWQELVMEADAAIAADEKLMGQSPENDENKVTQKNTNTGVLSGIERLAKAQTIEDLTNFARDEWGVKTIDLSDLDVKAVKGTFETMEATFNEYPELKGKVIEIGKKKLGIMCTNMFQDKDGFIITFNPGYYSDIDKVIKEYNHGLKLGYYPENTDWKNAGVHELGHVAHGVIAKNNPNNDYSWQANIDWNDHSTSKRIVAEAWNNVKKDYPKGTKVIYARRRISGYSEKTASETIAEAFSDVYTNKSKAEPLSREIVRLTKKELK